MNRLFEALVPVLITLWVGAMWTVGYIVAPTLFGTIGERALAGNVAGRLFGLVAWIGIGCATYLLLFLFARQGWRALRNAWFWVVAAMLVMTLVGQFGIQPLMAQMKAAAWPREVMDSVMRDRFAAWHGASSILYMLQSALGLALVLGARRLAR